MRKKEFQVKFYDFNLNINLKQNKSDLLRTWSESILDESQSELDDKNMKIENTYKSKIITNATRIIHDFSHCIIYR